ncbi:MAG: hemerythrin family protein [Ignavibacteriales bacterium]|nr:hemerythrin family protein [Ignavibacteriales bacterium]
METITWSKNYETGHPIVDGQHKKLFVLINNINAGISEKKSKDMLLEIIDGLSAYVETHFKTEEDLMISANYPDYPTHKQEHDSLRDQAGKLIQLFKLDKVDLTATISKFLSDWLKHHINEIDIKMIKWVQEQEKKN